MAPLDNSMTLELEGVDDTEMPEFEALYTVYDIKMQTLYASKK